MTATVIEDRRLHNGTGVFRDREDAGEQLARALEIFRGKDAIVLAIPSGGVPIGLAVCSRLALPFDLLIIRKIPIPGYTESGFAAISLDGDLVINEPLVRELRLSSEEIRLLAEPVREELLARNRVFREDRPWPKLAGKIAILVDDGLASGYTMLAAVRSVRRHNPSRIIVAVPTASASTIQLLASQVDSIVCLNIRSVHSFAVADAYINWYDLERTVVINLLKSHGFLGRN